MLRGTARSVRRDRVVLSQRKGRRSPNDQCGEDAADSISAALVLPVRPCRGRGLQLTVANKACVITTEGRFGYILFSADLYQPTFPRQLLTLGLMMTEQAGSGSQAPPMCSTKLGGLILIRRKRFSPVKRSQAPGRVAQVYIFPADTRG